MNKLIPVLMLMPMMASANEAAEQLQQRLKSLPQFTAEFSQQAFDFDDQLVAESKGTVALKAPLRFKWQQTEPDELLLTSNGGAVWYYDPYVEQVTISAVGDVLEQTPLPLLSSQDPKLWQQWQVANSGDCYSLTQQQGIEMTVCFAGKQIDTLQMVDAQGNRTLMTLTQFTDEAPADAEFEFIAPQGTYIDDQRQQ